MDLALRGDVEKLVETVVWFANLSRIRSPDKVAAKFYSLYKNPWLRNRKDHPSLEELRKWQKTTQRLLAIGVEYDRPRMIEDHEWLDGAFSVFLEKELRAEAKFTFLDGAIRERLIITPQTVWAFCRLGAALLIDRGREYHNWLRMCETCGRFMLEWERRRGAPSKFCSSKCRDKGLRVSGAIRQQRFRRKKSARR